VNPTPPQSASISIEEMPWGSAFANIREFTPTVSVKVNQKPAVLLSRWTPFKEINLAKSGIYKLKPEGNITARDQQILNQLSPPALTIVNQHDLFRIKNFYVDWDHIAIQTFNDETIYTAAFMVDFLFYKSNTLPAWAKTFGEVNQGTQKILGTLLLSIDDMKGASLFLQYYDESNLLKEVGQKIKELTTSKAMAQFEDQSRIEESVKPALEIQLNLQIDELIYDIQNASDVKTYYKKPTML